MLVLAVLVALQGQPGTLGPVAAEQVRKQRAPTRLQFDVKPAATVIYVDGKKRGRAKKVTYVRVKPGRHLVRLVYQKDETEFEVRVEKGQTLLVRYAFEDSGAAPHDDAPDGGRAAP